MAAIERAFCLERLYQNPTRPLTVSTAFESSARQKLSWIYRIATNYHPEGRGRTGDLTERSSSAIL
jgi:hypothetical protein